MKNLSAAIQAEIDPLVNKVGVHEYQKRPSKPNLPNVLKPSKFQLPMGFTEPCLH